MKTSTHTSKHVSLVGPKSVPYPFKVHNSALFLEFPVYFGEGSMQASSPGPLSHHLNWRGAGVISHREGNYIQVPRGPHLPPGDPSAGYGGRQMEERLDPGMEADGGCVWNGVWHRPVRLHIETVVGEAKLNLALCIENGGQSL